MDEEELLCVNHPIVEHKVKVGQTRRVLKCFNLGYIKQHQEHKKLILLFTVLM